MPSWGSIAGIARPPSGASELETTACYRVEELHNALRIRVHKSLELWERLILSFGMAVPVVSLSLAFFGWWSTILGLATAISVFTLASGARAQLYATKLEFVRIGNISRRGGSGRVNLCTADVRGLEFRDPAGGYSGLYAVTARKGYCILPFLDYAQTMEVICAIEKKFPGLAEHWRGNTASAPGSFLSDSLCGLF